MSKHTPGPYLMKGSVVYAASPIRPEENIIVAEVPDYGLPIGQQASNQRLFAAAPDLYQHVTEYLDLCEKMKNAKDSEERADYLSIMVGLKGEMKRTVEKVNGNE